MDKILAKPHAISQTCNVHQPEICDLDIKSSSRSAGSAILSEICKIRIFISLVLLFDLATENVGYLFLQTPCHEILRNDFCKLLGHRKV